MHHPSLVVLESFKAMDGMRIVNTIMERFLFSAVIVITCEFTIVNFERNYSHTVISDMTVASMRCSHLGGLFVLPLDFLLFTCFGRSLQKREQQQNYQYLFQYIFGRIGEILSISRATGLKIEQNKKVWSMKIL